MAWTGTRDSTRIPTSAGSPWWRPTIRWPQQARDLLDPRRSTLNPLWMPERGEIRNFAYGHLPLYLQSLGGHAVAALGRRLVAAGDGAGTLGELGRELESYGQYARHQPGGPCALGAL